MKFDFILGTSVFLKWWWLNLPDRNRSNPLFILLIQPALKLLLDAHWFSRSDISRTAIIPLRRRSAVFLRAPENRSHSANWLNSVTIPTYRPIYIAHKKFVAAPSWRPTINIAAALSISRDILSALFIRDDFDIRSIVKNARVSDPLTISYRCLWGTRCHQRADYIRLLRNWITSRLDSDLIIHLR